MRKEILIAIFFGITIGLILAFGIWRTNSSLKDNISQTADENRTVETEATAENSTFSINSPQDYDVITQNPVVISGISGQETLLVIATETEDFIRNLSNNQEFEAEISLEPAVNVIKFTSFNSGGISAEKLFTLVYSSEFRKETEESVSKPADESDATTSVRQKVQEKLQLALNRPKAVIGALTDISDSGIQIRNDLGQIDQVAIDEAVSYARINDTTASLKFSDLALGDHIVSMGYYDDNEVLLARRILVTEPKTPPDITIVYGSVTDVSGRIITIESGGIETELTFPRRWKGPEINEINIDDIVVAVYTTTNETQTIRTIEILFPTPTPEE